MITGEVNEDDQTLLGAGLGGGTVEEEEQARGLQEQLARQRQQRERTPPGAESDDTEDLRRRFRALQGSPPARRQRLSSPAPAAEWSQLAPPSPSDNNVVVDEDGRPVIPEPVEPLPLHLSGA